MTALRATRTNQEGIRWPLHSFSPICRLPSRACGRRTAYSACVLIVDDDPVCLQGLQDLLSFHLPQVCIHTADSGDMAVRLNRTRAFDAILSDVQMPGLDGLSLVADIKRIRPHTPVVLMTGSPSLMPLLTGSGAFGFMRKPVNTSYCVTALQHAIRYCALSRFVGKEGTQARRRSDKGPSCLSGRGRTPRIREAMESGVGTVRPSCDRLGRINLKIVVPQKAVIFW